MFTLKIETTATYWPPLTFFSCLQPTANKEVDDRDTIIKTRINISPGIISCSDFERSITITTTIIVIFHNVKKQVADCC